MNGLTLHMHWTAGVPFCFTSDAGGPPPVMSIVRHEAYRANLPVVV